jgi:hypothetical protein
MMLLPVGGPHDIRRAVAMIKVLGYDTGNVGTQVGGGLYMIHTYVGNC